MTRSPPNIQCSRQCAILMALLVRFESVILGGAGDAAPPAPCRLWELPWELSPA